MLLRRGGPCELLYDCHRQSLRFRIRCAEHHPPGHFGKQNDIAAGDNKLFPKGKSQIAMQFGREGQDPPLRMDFNHETLTDLRMAEMAPFSRRDTWAWEMPRVLATSIWVLPS